MNQIQLIESKIYEIRNQRVMLDRDLATLYQVETKTLNQAVKRNMKRFPPDFMFQLSNQEFTNLKSQIVTSSWGGTRKLPYAFTEQGVAMLAGLLNTEDMRKELDDIYSAIAALAVKIPKVPSSKRPVGFRPPDSD